MTAATKGIICPANEWTLLSEGKMKVGAIMRTVGSGKLITGSQKPAQPPGQNYLSVSHTRPANLQFEDTTTNVYFWTDGVEQTVEVIIE